MPFPIWHINMITQLQISAIYVHESIIYATIQLQKATIHKLSRSKVPKTQHLRKAGDVLSHRQMRR